MIVAYIFFIIHAAAVGLVSCSELYSAAAFEIVLGVITILMSLLCCCHFGALDLYENDIIRWLCCGTIFTLLLLFISFLFGITIMVAININFIYSDTADCNSPAVSVAIMGMSYVMLFLFGPFGLYSYRRARVLTNEYSSCWKSFYSEYLMK